MNKTAIYRRKVRAALGVLNANDARHAAAMTGLIVTTIFILLGVSALAGLATGVLLFKARAIFLASALLALLTTAFLFRRGFGLARDVLILIGSLAALQSAYLAGVCVRHLAVDKRERQSNDPRDLPAVAALSGNRRRSRRQPHRNIGEDHEQTEQYK
jgi:hypothetical protein